MFGQKYEREQYWKIQWSVWKLNSAEETMSPKDLK